MGVSLYTSRIVLQVLGVEDFGIYSLVGGIIVFFSFISISMTGATQRYLNFELGKESRDGVHQVFCISVNIYVLIALLIALIGETIGLWAVNNMLNIPEERMYAANWVYQLSILSFIVGILRIPYNASVLAYERMNFYAIISIAEAILKLLILFVLSIVSYDKLILYAILTFLTVLIVFLLYIKYCLNNFETCKYVYMKNNGLLKQLLSFSGWNMFGNMALIGSNQGINILLNIFYGVTVNAAIGVANQVNTALYSFVTNLQTAFNPQITKSFASGDLEKHKRLLFQASRYSYYLLLILAIPILFYTNFILNFWLGGIVPKYASEFVQIIICISLVEAISGSLWVSIYAFGKIVKYQLIISCVLLLNVPVSYVLLNNGLHPVFIFLVKLIVIIILYFYRLYFVKSYLSISIRFFLIDFLGRILAVTLILSLSVYYLKKILLPFEDVTSVIFFTFFTFFCAILLISIIGIEPIEQKKVINYIKQKIKR
jgi:O-antigen/teichoic acid export membrane protein